MKVKKRIILMLLILVYTSLLSRQLAIFFPAVLEEVSLFVWGALFFLKFMFKILFEMAADGVELLCYRRREVHLGSFVVSTSPIAFRYLCIVANGCTDGIQLCT